VILTSDGTNITAKNTATNETFTGTLASFNARFSGKSLNRVKLEAVKTEQGYFIVVDGIPMMLSEISPVTILTASGSGKASSGFFRGISVRAAVGFPQTVTVYDALSATGTPVAVFTVNAIGKYYWDGSWTTPGIGKGGRRPMSIGCYVSISGGTSRTIDVEVE
jgi:hypothetical protein